jgi:hypothetical protein
MDLPLRKNESMNARQSICGPLSIALPLVGVGVEFLCAPHHDLSRLNNGFAAAASGLLWLGGLGFAIAGMRRAEPLRWLPAIGFGLGVVLLLAHCTG